MPDLTRLVCALAVTLASATAAGAAAAPATRPTTSPSATAPLKPEEVEQIVAPIALYPDSLLAQVLMASTYPLEIVQADRWVKANPTLKDNAEELNKLPWDPSVKSLLDFPQVLTMMSEKLDWTVKLGDAFIADQKSIMDAVQRLRGRAYAQGNLKSTNEQKVTVEAAAPATAPAAAAPSVSVQTNAPAPQVIVIQSTQPSVVYVPTYNPTVVYGAWPYPAYPPAYYYPPGYVAAASVVSFGVGVAVGAAWGHAWGGCNWHGGDVDVNVNRNVNYNTNINRQNYQAKYNNANRTSARTGGGNTFQHDASHRQGVAYRDSATSERYRGAGASQQTAQARDAYRGRAEAGRSQLNQGGADAYRGGGGSAGGANARSGTGGRSAASASPQSAERSRQASGARSSGFGGVDSGGANARAASNRGQASRSGTYSSGGSRSGGGAARSSGSRGGGGRGGGRGR